MASELVDRDTEHLGILSIFQYATAGVTALIGTFPLLYVAMGVFILLLPAPASRGDPEELPSEMGFFFIVLGLAFAAGGWGLAAAHFLTARFLKQQRHYWFCIVVSAVACFVCMFISGVVGIATIVILLRPQVRELFRAEKERAPAVSPSSDGLRGQSRQQVGGPRGHVASSKWG